jgi:hypothetical protein
MPLLFFEVAPPFPPYGRKNKALNNYFIVLNTS